MPEQEKNPTASIVSFGSARLDLGTGQLWRGTHEVKVTPKAFAALCYFVAHPSHLVTKDDLFAAVWPQTIVTEATLASCIQELRAALRDDAKAPRYIETVHRRGFRFIAEVVSGEGASSQHSVVRREENEAKQKANGKHIEQVEDLRLEVEEPLPVFPSSLEPPASSPPQPPVLNPQSSPASRFTWSVVLAAILLLLITILTVQYLSLPLPNTQPLAPNTQPPLPLPDKPSIIVLPFTNMSEDPTQEYFSDGMTEELTSSLSRLPSLFVIARHSAFTYKGKAVKVREVSREMGVRYVLAGSVRRAGERIRVTVQLIDGTTGGHVWSERYEQPFTETLAVQDGIVQHIMTTLKLQLTLEEQGYLVRKRTDNLEAYDSYLRGLASFFRTTKEDNLRARQMFEKAISLDAQYAEAYAYLAGTYYIEWNWRWSQDPHTLEQALAMGQRAVALDDALPTAHARLGMIYAVRKQYEQALAESERAVALDPNDADSYTRRGHKS